MDRKSDLLSFAIWYSNIAMLMIRGYYKLGLQVQLPNHSVPLGRTAVKPGGMVEQGAAQQGWYRRCKDLESCIRNYRKMATLRPRST